MTERRQSARSSAVKEREVLEEKLVRRKQAEEVKAQKKRSKALQDLYSQELETFEEDPSDYQGLLFGNFGQEKEFQ